MLVVVRGESMKKLITLLMICLLPAAAATAQEVRPVPAEISTLADQVVDLVLRSIPRRVQRPVVIAVAGLQAEGRETQLGELFAMITTSRLVNKQDSRITVLAGQHLEVIRRSSLLPMGYPDIETGLPPDYVVNGKAYLADWFLVEVEGLEGGGFMSIYTRGTTDTYMEVYGPDDPYVLLVENDDSEDNNPRVGFSVATGQKYWVKVRGYDESTTGSYLIVAEIEMFRNRAAAVCVFVPRNRRAICPLRSGTASFASRIVSPSILSRRLPSQECSTSIPCHCLVITWLGYVAKSFDFSLS